MSFSNKRPVCLLGTLEYSTLLSSPQDLCKVTFAAAAGSRGIKNLISLKQRTSTTSSQNQSTQQACLRKNQSEHAFLIRLSIHGTQRLNCFNLYSAMYTARILHEWNLKKIKLPILQLFVAIVRKQNCCRRIISKKKITKKKKIVKTCDSKTCSII